MASINYATREISCKIVYYGPGLSGKTTNLQIIHRKVPDKDKSEMVSLATETDRTLFFDFLPLDLGQIKGFSTKFQLYTVPGQVYYNATRKLVLRGVDGVVFVVDSQADKMQENLESFLNLEENLREYGHSVETIPVVLQFNKRDLPNILSLDQLNASFNKYRLPYFEAVAATGVGVFTTLKAIGKSVIDKFNAKYAGFQGTRRPARPKEDAAPAAAPPAHDPSGQMPPMRQQPTAPGNPFSGNPGGFRSPPPQGTQNPFGASGPNAPQPPAQPSPQSFQQPQQQAPQSFGSPFQGHGQGPSHSFPQPGAPNPQPFGAQGGQGGASPPPAAGSPFLGGNQGGQGIQGSPRPASQPFAPKPQGQGGGPSSFMPQTGGVPAGGSPGFMSPSNPFSNPKPDGGSGFPFAQGRQNHLENNPQMNNPQGQPGGFNPAGAPQGMQSMSGGFQPPAGQGAGGPGNIPLSPFVEPSSMKPAGQGEQPNQGGFYNQGGFNPPPQGPPPTPPQSMPFGGTPQFPGPGNGPGGAPNFAQGGFGQQAGGFHPPQSFPQPPQQNPQGSEQASYPPQQGGSNQGGNPPGGPVSQFQPFEDKSGIMSSYEDNSQNFNFKTKKLSHPNEKKKGFFNNLFKKEK